MRKLLSLLLAAILLLPTIAQADTITIDLDTATADELLSAQLAIAAVLERLEATAPVVESPDKDAIVITGEGTTIHSDISIPYGPSRVILIAEDDTMRITLLGRDESRILSNLKETITAFEKPVTFDVLAEGDGAWTLTFSPIRNTESPSAFGTGTYISDYFTLDEPEIVTVTMDNRNLIDLSNGKTQCTIYLSWQLDNGSFDGDEIFRGNIPGIVTKDVILKPYPSATRYLYRISCDPATLWSIAPKD